VYWRLGEQDARGNAVKETRHDSVSLETRRSFDPLTGRIDTLQSGSATPALSLQSWDLDFDLAGNLVRRKDLRSGFNETAYYDRLDRMTRINLKGPGVPGQGTDTLLIAYDSIGNICQKTAGGVASPYTYPGRAGCGVGGTPGSSGGSSAARPHAVSGAFGKTYFYDAAGNQHQVRQGTSDLRSVDYDAYHMPTGMIEGSFVNPLSETSFSYDASHARVKRVDVQGGGTTTTRYIGATERIEGSAAGCITAGCVRIRRAIGSALILVSTFTGAVSDPTLDYRYLFADHLGSVEVITDQTGATAGANVDRTSFDAHGKRRDPANWQTAVLGPVGHTTKRGFTGHEHVDRLGLVHFGGRLHDPELGRFIQADPFVEDDATQGLNRYSYVLNNPLTLTDPSGYFTGKQMAMLALTVVVNVYMPGIANGLLGITEAGAMPGVLIAGATSGAINGGTEGAVIGAFSAGLFHAIGSGFANVENLAGWMKNGAQLSTWGRVAKAVTHGFAGGIMHTLQGGQFGHGFASAGITQAATPAIGKIDNVLGEAFASAILGGSVSAATGGKFGHGAISGSFQYAFNESLHLNNYADNFLDMPVEQQALMGDALVAVATTVAVEVAVGKGFGLISRAFSMLRGAVAGASAGAKAVKGATEIAQEGGRHAGQLQQFLKQTPDQLQRTVRSFDKQIAKHEGWIANPASKVSNFSQLRPEHQQNLLHHWKQDIARHQELRSIAQDVLKGVQQ
jgi:RHS repeat-associated protein